MLRDPLLKPGELIPQPGLFLLWAMSDFPNLLLFALAAVTFTTLNSQDAHVPYILTSTSFITIQSCKLKVPSPRLALLISSGSAEALYHPLLVGPGRVPLSHLGHSFSLPFRRRKQETSLRRLLAQKPRCELIELPELGKRSMSFRQTKHTARKKAKNSARLRAQPDMCAKRLLVSTRVRHTARYLGP